MISLAAKLSGVHVILPGGVHALSGVDAQIVEGAITGLVGESGSGKTTLCRVLVGLQRVNVGEVVVYGQSIGARRGDVEDRHRRSVQMLFQDARGSLSPRLTVRALLNEPISIHRVDRNVANARLIRLISNLGISPILLGRYPYQLSDGQARRVALARALIVEPGLLIADEPTAGLDLSIQGEVLNLLVDEHRTLGLTIMICSHNLSVISRVAVYLIVMYMGEVVEEGLTASVFSVPGHPYTAALLSASGGIASSNRGGRVVRDGLPASIVNPPSGCRFHTRCPQAVLRCAEERPKLRSWGSGKVRCHYPLGQDVRG